MNFYLHYQIGRVGFATLIDEIKEIARTKTIFTESNLPKNVTGFFELRKRRVCLFDLPNFLGIETSKNFEIIVTEINNGWVGFKVEKVYGVIASGEVLPYPLLIQKKDYLNGLLINGKEILQILSLRKILSGVRFKAIQKYL
jgi:chemotaxis signal transduction protein